MRSRRLTLGLASVFAVGAILLVGWQLIRSDSSLVPPSARQDASAAEAGDDDGTEAGADPGIALVREDAIARSNAPQLGASVREVREWFERQGVELVEPSRRDKDAFVEDAMKSLEGYPREEATRDGDPIYNQLLTKMLATRCAEQIEALQKGNVVTFRYLHRANGELDDVALINRAVGKFPDWYMCSHYGYSCHLVTLVAKPGSATTLAKKELARRREFLRID